jgi:CheY-like chemotaxis protein
MSTHILVVDDSPLYLESFCNLLQSCFPHVTITTAEDATTALSLTRLIAFDLIIIDYQLQSLTGGDVVRHLRRRSKATGILPPPIILMSSLTDAAVYARTMGAVGFLHKPVFEEELLALVGPLLEQRTVPEQPATPDQYAEKQLGQSADQPIDNRPRTRLWRVARRES